MAEVDEINETLFDISAANFVALFDESGYPEDCTIAQAADHSMNMFPDSNKSFQLTQKDYILPIIKPINKQSLVVLEFITKVTIAGDSTVLVSLVDEHASPNIRAGFTFDGTVTKGHCTGKTAITLNHGLTLNTWIRYRLDLGLIQSADQLSWRVWPTYYVNNVWMGNITPFVSAALWDQFHFRWEQSKTTYACGTNLAFWKVWKK